MILFTKQCPACGNSLPVRPTDLASAGGAPFVRCTACGKRSEFSFLVSLCSGFIGLVGGGFCAVAYLRFVESAFGGPIGLVPFLLMFPIGIAIFLLTHIVLSSACHLAYQRLARSRRPEG
jgi:predicted Zn finger-like uncharacterized protein